MIKTSFIHDVMLAEPSTSGSTGTGNTITLARLFENSGETSTKHQDNVQLDTLYLKDPGTWPNINDTVLEQIIHPCDWLVWSTSRQVKLYCLKCILLAENISAPFVNHSNLANREGFSPRNIQWKKLYNRLPVHENSAEHRNCFCKWKSLQQILLHKGVDSELQKQIAYEADKWKAILGWLLDVMLFLASRGLPFQGDSTEIGDVHN
ncbi:hypothetical protein PR048_001346 [Dryococelus australis]|uniref:Uncharacterized protein n=1 Tax=Dryococelus australis TaxID=614101 RepID=A0ABQ9IIK7_9NEOP|nr:hypothetical protein PR048_001346 [Dryococelus australis]